MKGYDMKKNIGYTFMLLLFAIMMGGCCKVEIKSLKTRYGEACINDVKLYDYATVKEQLSHSIAYQIMPLADFIKTKDNILYLQTTLREEDEENPNNYWFILMGIPEEDGLPVLDKEYKICFNGNVDYGSVHRSFKYTRELENQFNSVSGNPTPGIAGIRTPTSGDELIPLIGKISFYKYDAKNGIYYSRYILESVEINESESCVIEGEFHKQITLYN